MACSPRFYEILINHSSPGGFVTRGIMRGGHVASWHKVGAAPSGWIISCIIRVKSINEWHVGKTHCGNHGLLCHCSVPVVTFVFA